VEVVIDTTAIRADFWLRQPASQALLHAARRGHFQLVVPELVMRETINKFREELQKATRSLGGNVRTVNRLMGRAESRGIMPISIEPLPLDSLVEIYGTYLREELEGAGGFFPGFPGLSHASIVDRILTRRKPSGAEKESYRDILLWEAVVDSAARGQTAFVTNNWRDFANPDNHTDLHKELEADLQARGLPSGSVRLFETIAAYVDDRVTPATERLQELRSRLVEDPAFRAEFTRQLAASADLFQPGDSVMIGSTGVENTEIFSVDETTFSVDEVKDAFLVSDDEVGLSLIASVEVIVDGYAYKADAYGIEEFTPFEIWRFDWNDHYSWVAAPLKATLEIDARYLPQEGEVDAVFTSADLSLDA
jgi:hypothetical protein